MLIEGNICSEQEHLPQAKCLSAVAVCTRNNRMQSLKPYFYSDREFKDMACWVWHSLCPWFPYHTCLVFMGKTVGGGGKETLQMMRDDTEKLQMGYLSQAVLFWVSVFFVINTNNGC